MSILLESKWALLKIEEGIIKIGNCSSSVLRATEHFTLSPPYRRLEPHPRHCFASFMSSKATLTGFLSFPSLIPPLPCLNATLALQNAFQSCPGSSPLPSDLAFLHHTLGTLESRILCFLDSQGLYPLCGHCITALCSPRPGGKGRDSQEVNMAWA